MLTPELNMRGVVAALLVLGTASCSPSAGRVRWMNSEPDNPSDPFAEPIIFSSLYDPHDQELQVFMEARSNISDTAFLACSVFSKNGTLEQRLNTSLEAFENRPSAKHDILSKLWKPLKLQCIAPPEWLKEGGATLAIQMVDAFAQGGSVEPQWLKQMMTVEVVPQEPAGPIGACITPYVTARPTLEDWLMYHIQLGISDFHIYIPEGGYIDSTIEGFSHEQHIRQEFPALPFNSHLVWWHYYFPSPQGQYFGQATTYNDCVFRSRRQHKYLYIADIDEFLAVGQQGTLLQFLEERTDVRTNSVVVPVAWYKVDCPRLQHMQGYDGLDVMATSEPDEAFFEQTDPERWYNNAKGIVLPLNVITQHVHMPLKTVPGTASLWVQPPELSIRHLRCMHASPALN